MKGIDIFEHTHLYSAYGDDTTFFLRNKRSFNELLNTFATFSKCSGMKPNYEKWNIAGIEGLKIVKVALCGMKFIDLCNDTIKITWNPLFVQQGKAKWKKFTWEYN